MSFILDALRKSEHERQRQAEPGLLELRPAMARPTLPIWAIALAALLAINLVILAVLMLKGRDASAPATTTVAARQISAPPAGTMPAPVVPAATGATTLPPTDEPARVAHSSAADADPFAGADSPDPDAYSASDEEFESSAEFAAAETVAAGPELQPPPRQQSANQDEAAARLPTINDVALQGASVPELHLDIHVYATQPAERFVFLNNRKYREGGETPDGTRIERITRDGVVLNHRGVRFLLPRQ